MPLHIKADPGSVAERVIASDSIKIVKQLSELLHGKLINSNRGFFLYTGSHMGIPVSTVYHGLGGPSESIVLEELAQLGVKRVIALETSVLSYRKEYSVMISSSASYDDGGTIGEYITPQKVVVSAVPSFGLLMKLDDAFTKRGIKHVIGQTLSVNTLTYEKTDEIKFLCTELHCAVLYVLSQIRGFESACVVIQDGGKNIPKKIIADIENSVSDAIIAE